MNLVDANGLIHRSYHQFDESLRLLHLESLIERIELLTHGDIIFALDSPKSLRKDEYSPYKGNRKAKTDDFYIFLRESIKVFNRHGKCVKQDGYEADDIAGQFAMKTKHKLTLITADKDWLQLVSQLVDVLLFRPKGEKRVNLSNFEEETGLVNPQAFTLYQILCGDRVDNIPSIITPAKGKKYANENYNNCTTSRLVDDFGADVLRNYKLIKLPYYRCLENARNKGVS